ncbi:MAG: YgiT-type zinc finger protein [Defluviitaleaceae bacterium]|nr:YgiT-type zinc finger protein [Defluviitaleaceae bacterium]
MVRGVPCYKCTQCGEVTFDLAVGERLEQIVDTLKNSISEIAVVQYSSVAA